MNMHISEQHVNLDREQGALERLGVERLRRLARVLESTRMEKISSDKLNEEMATLIRFVKASADLAEYLDGRRT